MSEIYKNPPLIEALCEFQFEDDENWDWTIPGIFYEEIKIVFTIKRQENLLSINFESKGETIVTHTDSENKVSKMIFSRQDNSALIQIAPNSFTINNLIPYQGWSVFKKLIIEYLGIYIKIAKPKRIKRIGLRYINKFENISNIDSLADYLNVEPKMPMNHPIINFFIRNELAYNDAESTLICNVGLVSDKEIGKNYVILDLDFSTASNKYTLISDYIDWIDKAHFYIEESFNSFITEKAKVYMRGE